MAETVHRENALAAGYRLRFLHLRRVYRAAQGAGHDSFAVFRRIFPLSVSHLAVASRAAGLFIDLLRCQPERPVSWGTWDSRPSSCEAIARFVSTVPCHCARSFSSMVTSRVQLYYPQLLSKLLPPRVVLFAKNLTVPIQANSLQRSGFLLPKVQHLACKSSQVDGRHYMCTQWIASLVKANIRNSWCESESRSIKCSGCNLPRTAGCRLLPCGEHELRRCVISYATICQGPRVRFRDLFPVMHVLFSSTTEWRHCALILFNWPSSHTISRDR